jgi:hypothetical protein
MAARYVRYAAAAAAIGGAAYGIYRYIADAECLAGACIRAPRRRSSLGHLASPVPRRGDAEEGAVRRIRLHRRTQPVQTLTVPQARSSAKAKRLPQTLSGSCARAQTRRTYRRWRGTTANCCAIKRGADGRASKRRSTRRREPRSSSVRMARRLAAHARAPVHPPAAFRAHLS